MPKVDPGTVLQQLRSHETNEILSGLLTCALVLHIENEEIIQEVIRLAMHSDPKVRRAVPDAMRPFIDDPRARQALADLLEDADPRVVEEALWAAMFENLLPHDLELQMDGVPEEGDWETVRNLASALASHIRSQNSQPQTG